MTHRDTWTASWIWLPQDGGRPYHQTIIARKVFSLTAEACDAIASADLRITADSAYRLFVNGAWVNDGPCRSWPEHTQYDVIDVAGYLKPGDNEIRVIARFWSTGTFHQISQQPGLLAQLDLVDESGGVRTIVTDASWQVAESRAWAADTPKVSIQMEPQEIYDARLEDPRFVPATVLAEADAGPWQDLNPRDVPLLTKEPFHVRAFVEANLVRRPQGLTLCLPAAYLTQPDLTEANHSFLQAGGIATRLELATEQTLILVPEGLTLFIDGDAVEGERIALSPGAHLLLAFVTEATGHRKEKTLHVASSGPHDGEPARLQLINPLRPDHDNPWAWIAFPEADYAGDDIRWFEHGFPEALDAQVEAYLAEVARLGSELRRPEDIAALGPRVRCRPAHEMFVRDTHPAFLHREPVGDAALHVHLPAGLIYDNAEMTVVHPSPDGDVELVYDLGEQAIGYYDFDLIAEAGVEIDIYGVEYISPAGTIQHTYGNRNGMRYITRVGRNRFTSLKRRSGRYLFITLRNQHAPVRIRNLHLIVSTYPVNAVGAFRCSDERLTRIWEISARTLKLCMEDTFTDCPLYEQTLWVGDARNEAVFAYPVFGAVDIGQRCARLAAQSLERYPIVGSQVPTTWDVLLPAWSFLWGISIWDAYAFTGDRAFIEEMWPAVVTNLEGAEGLLDPTTGLFRGAFWNMFDWSGIDDRHEIVLHNSMLLVGAIDAAQRCADVLRDGPRRAWLDELRKRLTESLNRLWDPERRAYPDSIHEDGSPSRSTSQHTSFLALLYDIIPPEHAQDALANMLTPPDEMVRVGSPFAMMTYYEALERAGHEDAVIASIYDAYLPMLEAGATTVWEVFPSSDDRPSEFPTRSHCHAWSSAPAYFLNRILLGIRPTAPGGAEVEVSPRLSGLSWAEGTVATIRGPLHVTWHADEEVLRLTVDAPATVDVRFVRNETHGEREIVFNGKVIEGD